MSKRFTLMWLQRDGTPRRYQTDSAAEVRSSIEHLESGEVGATNIVVWQGTEVVWHAGLSREQLADLR